MYGPARPCKVFGHDNGDSCVNVSGLWRVDCCCSQAMMRSARRSQIRAQARFFARAYDTPIDWLVILLEPRNLWRGGLSDRRVAPLVDGARPDPAEGSIGGYVASDSGRLSQPPAAFDVPGRLSINRPLSRTSRQMRSTIYRANLQSLYRSPSPPRRCEV